MLKYQNLQGGETQTLRWYSMFSGISGSYEDLTEEQRSSLADLLEVRDEYNKALVTINQMRIELLRNYSLAGEQRLNSYSTLVLTPIRARTGELTIGLAKEAVDFEGLKGMLPMVLMALAGNINIPLLLTAANLEPDVIDNVISAAKDFIKQGM